MLDGGVDAAIGVSCGLDEGAEVRHLVHGVSDGVVAN